MLTRRDFVVGMVAASLPVAATLDCVVFIDSFRNTLETSCVPFSFSRRSTAASCNRGCSGNLQKCSWLRVDGGVVRSIV
jgi:hypothetical protein